MSSALALTIFCGVIWGVFLALERNIGRVAIGCVKAAIRTISGLCVLCAALVEYEDSAKIEAAMNMVGLNKVFMFNLSFLVSISRFLFPDLCVTDGSLTYNSRC